MTQYKYHLDKTSKKYNCPKCNKKRFVKYVETETNNYANDQYGRCDRETSCGYSFFPNDNTITHYSYIAKVPTEASYIEKETLKKTLTKYEINPLANFLYSHYSKDQVQNTFHKYQVGTSNQFNNSTVFWQMDNTGNIRSGKIMAYDITTGKRLKDGNGNAIINWVHTALKKPDYILKQCLFGLHLLNDNVKQIAIVESEKTAIIMSLEFPNYTWMSTGSLQGFKYEYLSPLKGKNIVAFPDKGGYDKWKKTADDLNNVGFNLDISKILENEENEDGWDLVDMMEYESKK